MSNRPRRGRSAALEGPYGAASRRGDAIAGADFRSLSPRGRRGTVRGKRRGRTEGDASMNTDMSASPGGSRFNPYQNKRRGKAASPANGVKVIVSGHKEGDWNDLLNFISRRTLESVVIFSNPRHIGRTTVLTVANEQQAQVLAKLDGISFAGNMITIKVGGPSGPKKAKPSDNTVVDAMRAVFLARYNSEHKFLDLENLAAEPSLLSLGIRPFGTATPGSQIGAVIMKLISEVFPDIETLSVAKNQLKSLNSLSTLSTRLPNLKNLSLKDNLISKYKDLEPLCGTVSNPKIKNLRELMLAGNPLRNNEIKQTGDELVYRSEITRRFPSITMLDAVEVAPSVSFDISDGSVTNAKGSVVLPAPICTGFADSPITKELAANFVRAFFEAYDTDRSRLLDAYDPRASFSLNVGRAVIGRETFRPKHHRATEWARYDSHNRNLHEMHDLPSRLQKLHVGNSDVIVTIRSLPATSHSKMLEDPRRFCVDAWQLSGLAEATGAAAVPEGHPAMFVYVHGEFTDVPTKTIRSFDRTFTLAPSVPGSPAQNAGWPVVILSDILTLRQYSEFSAWQPDAGTVTGPSPPTSSDQLNEIQKRLASELSRVTGLNTAFAVQCLVDNQWNYEVALTRFNELKAQGVIPPEAFAK